MYSEEETELRDLIIQNLESCGFLNKIKAELRAGVFLALEEDGNLKNKIPLFNKQFDEFAGTTNGKMLLSIVREFLEYFNLHFTLSVFDPEIAITSPCISRSNLCKQFNLGSDIAGPVLLELIKGQIKDDNQNLTSKLTEDIQSVSNKTSTINKNISVENVQTFNEKYTFEDKAPIPSNLLKEDYATTCTEEDTETSLNDTGSLLKPNSETLNKTFTEKKVSDITTEFKSAKDDDNIHIDTKDILSSDHDPFFDEPLPSKKPSFFNFAETFKDKSETEFSSDHDPFFDEPLPPEKPSYSNFVETFKDKSETKFSSNVKNDIDKSRKGSLSSLRDLPSLTANNEWTFSTDPKNTFPSLESQKSVSSSEASNEEIINLDPRESFQKKDSDIAESNEESSEKPISEESIEEDIEDDSMSAGLEDILNSSMSLAEDNTTDQTVSQTSVVEAAKVDKMQSKLMASKKKLPLQGG